MDTEYCNKCGLLHDPEDGDCGGCELNREIEVLRDLNEEMKLALRGRDK